MYIVSYYKFKRMNKVLLFSASLFVMSLFNGQNQSKATVDLPYSYGFETSDLDGWTIVNAGTGNDWEVATASSQTPDPSEGEKYMLYYFHENPANSYLFSKGINLKAGEDINLKFDYMGTDIVFSEKMEVLIGTAPNVAAQTKQLWINEDIYNYPYNTASVDFTVPADGVYYIAFRAFSDADQFYLSLDNIKVSRAGLATKESSTAKLSFYPNPTKDVLNIDNTIDIENVNIYDLSGKKVLTQNFNSKKVSVNVSSLAKGTYMVRVASKNSAKTIKMIKD